MIVRLAETEVQRRYPGNTIITKHLPSTTRMRGEEHIWVKQTTSMKPQTYKESKLIQSSHLGIVRRDTTFSFFCLVGSHHENMPKYNIDSLKPHFYIVKLGFTEVYIFFSYFYSKHRLWVLGVLVRTVSQVFFFF